MIGLSLSFCIQDIISGTVRESDVEEIISSTLARTPQDWHHVVSRYRDTYWRSNPDEGEAIFNRLLAAGKITQPRLEGSAGHSISRGHWVESRDDVPPQMSYLV